MMNDALAGAFLMMNRRPAAGGVEVFKFRGAGGV
jgi:hypothetical protein